MELYSFDENYVQRLRDGDPSTESHFVRYFGQLLRIKLRSRLTALDAVEDLQQETFIRVLRALRSQGGIRQPERLGAFVNSVCNNVVFEFYRASARSLPINDPYLEAADKTLNIEGLAISKEDQERVRKILAAMPARDRDLLRAVFLEEKDKNQVCRQFGVDRNYLRVLLYRAKDRFRVLLEKETEEPRDTPTLG